MIEPVLVVTDTSAVLARYGGQSLPYGLERATCLGCIKALRGLHGGEKPDND
jgi:hypothetical protein